MENALKFYRDKKKDFKFKLSVTGANLEDSFARLCLKFPSVNRNLFFESKIKSTGEVIIQIPALKEVLADSGVAIIEVVADSTYFKVYEKIF